MTRIDHVLQQNANAEVSELLSFARQNGQVQIRYGFGPAVLSYRTMRGYGLYAIHSYPESSATPKRELFLGNRSALRRWLLPYVEAWRSQ